MKKLSTYLFLTMFATVSLSVYAQQNILAGSSMEANDEGFWSVSTLETDASNSSSYEFGYTTDTPINGEGGSLHYTITNSGTNGAHLMFYQQVTIQNGQRYVCDMAVKAIQEMNNSWFEVYLGATEPADGADYGSGQTALGGFKWSGWEAGCTGLDLFDGSLKTDGCLAGSSDTIMIEGEGETVMYFGFKAGIWATATTVEFVVDNVNLINIDAEVSAIANDVPSTIIYPNPSNNQLNIQSFKSFSEARILNLLGQKVVDVTKDSKTIDVSSLKSGIYLIEFTYDNQQVETVKFQKN